MIGKKSNLAIFFTVLASTVGLIALAATTKLPILADDYTWHRIALSTSELRFADFYTFSRLPIATVLATLSLKWNFWTFAPQFFVFLFFSVHALAFAVLFLKTLKAGEFFSAKHLSTWTAVSTLFALHPNNYEIHLWHILSMHSVGALLIALAFQFRPQLGSGSGLLSPRSLYLGMIFGTTASILTYETFGLLWIGLVGLSLILTPKMQSLKKVLNSKYQGLKPKSSTSKTLDYSRDVISQVKIYASVSFAILILSVIIKFGLSRITGFLQMIGPDENLFRIFDHLKNVLKTIGLIHFYKANWISTLFEWIAIILVVLGVIKNKILPKSKVLLLLSLPWISAAPLLLISYSAQRAYYGPQIVKSLVLATLLYVLAVSPSAEGNKVHRRMVVSAFLLFFFSYLIQWELIFNVKRKNYRIIEDAEKKVVTLMENCTSPCVLEVPPPVPGVSKDYVFPEFMWMDFYERLHLKYFRDKPIQFQINRSLMTYDSNS